MTEKQLFAAIAYVQNRDDIASKDGYQRYDLALKVVLEAAQNLLDIAQDEGKVFVPLLATVEMMEAGMDVLEGSEKEVPFKVTLLMFANMVKDCPRDERLPEPDFN